MAVRLNVMIIRPSGRAASMDAQCDHVVGTLLGRPGIDVTLLDRIPRADEDSTERMAIESVTGDAAVLAWADPDDIVIQMTQLGRTYVRASHRRDPAGHAATPSGASQLFCFDMRRTGAAESILHDLQRLLEVRQTPTFGISLTSSANIPPASIPSPKSPTDAAPTPPAGGPSSASASNSLGLDDLVDELDRLDL